MSKYNILAVDDDPDIREVLSVLLRSDGYEVFLKENGEDALKLMHDNKEIDLVILDIMMPGMDGVEVCEKIRASSTVPVLFLTAKSQDNDKVSAYTGGGDDYLVKPFSQTELLMKVKSLLRRYKEYQSNTLKGGKTVIGGNIYLDSKARGAVKGDVFVPLTDKEYDILRYFMEHIGETVDNKNLYEKVWGEKYFPSTGNTIMVHILNLRKKLEDDANTPKLIKTVWGKGYRVD